MCWHFNPPEPTGQPTRPYPFRTDLQASIDGLLPAAPAADSVTDLFTKGRCGDCHAVPKVWRLDIPIDANNPYSGDYSGTVYLRRIRYEYAGVFTGYYESKCSWGQIEDEPIKGANTYRGRFDKGWFLTFTLNGWELLTPVESGTILFEPDAQSAYEVAGDFNCLGVTTFHNPKVEAQYGFPFTPTPLKIEPFYP